MSIKKKLSTIRKHKFLYFLVIPGIAYFIIFKYIPMLGIIIAFKDYNIFHGLINSPGSD